MNKHARHIPPPPRSILGGQGVNTQNSGVPNDTRKPGARNPGAQGLYDPGREKDSCGIGFVADIRNRKSRRIIDMGLSILCNVTHRGAVGADPKAGDGVGMTVQIPDGFFRRVMADTPLPPVGQYGIAMVYLPSGSCQKRCRAMFEAVVREEGQHFIGWRDVPTNRQSLGESIAPCAPTITQAVIARKDDPRKDDHETGDDFERHLFFIHRKAQNAITAMADRDAAFGDFYIASCSSRTLVYKGMVIADEFRNFFPDLTAADFTSALALVHQRFSTNTFPSWGLAQPFHYLCHNGEINTLRGNLNWMKARARALGTGEIAAKMQELDPMIPENMSDSACLDHALAIMLAGGYDIARAVMTLIPEAWNNNPNLDTPVCDFYRYQSTLMEPWDGPAAVAFTDGRKIGAVLDRNGLRPARYFITDDDLLVLASESGVVDMDDAKIVQKWRLQPGKILLADLENKRIIDDAEIKNDLAKKRPWQKLYHSSTLRLDDIGDDGNDTTDQPRPPTHTHITKIAAGFGYNREDIECYLKPMLKNGMEPIGSMGNDTPVSVLSARAKLLYTYFKQCFAQVTNPPIDPIREELVMDLTTLIGAKSPLFGPDDPGAIMRLETNHPILDVTQMASLSRIAHRDHNDEPRRQSPIRTILVDICYPYRPSDDADNHEGDLEAAIDALCRKAEKATRDGYRILILSDRNTDAEHIAIPSLLATAGVHYHLIRRGLRTSVGIVLESGEAREPHHFALLGSYGAQAIHPWLALEMVARTAPQEGIDPIQAQRNYRKAIGKAILKIMSKIGISTYLSYCGAQIFDAIGLDSSFVDRFFTGTASRIGGIGLDQIARDSRQSHHAAWNNGDIQRLDDDGEYAFRMDGESHAWTPTGVADLQHAVRGNLPDKYRSFAEHVNARSRHLLTLRGLMEIRGPNRPIPLADVEPAANIVKRFATGAMSFGSISREAHTTLAIGMNRIGGKSNTGEGGEERDRFRVMDNGDSMRSAIKQVASGRFGVTAEYLVNADDIQIKIAQGAKPGEGGQLPGHKVDHVIATVRHSTPGVGLISPPPHHDIYSIEDLAQLIFDLKNVNEKARISVKLVSEVGVGIIAAGVAKARADHVTISGYDGGTGASPLTSIKHAGLPWEIGLAETQQTLVLNRLRDRISVQVDGGLRTGRDVVIGALLGADEFGFSTAPLISIGCIMMRKCHLNTCPVGIATQNPVLRKRFTGAPEHVINYFFFVAEEVRQIMAEKGVQRFNDLIGRSDWLDTKKAVENWKAHRIDLAPILYAPKTDRPEQRYHTGRQEHPIKDILDRKIIARAHNAITDRQPALIRSKIRNTDRSVGAMLSGKIAQLHGHEGLPEDCLHIDLHGHAGQSFGAFLVHGVTLSLQGEANDYVGKGLSGGKIIIVPPPSERDSAANIIIGNTVLYGAIGGECYFSGVAGERFAVRNSGAVAVVEGAGDHCCEYMTGGCIVVLGDTGRNFAAGMSGGIAYIFDPGATFKKRCNQEMVDITPLMKPRAIDGSTHPKKMYSEKIWVTGLKELMESPLENDEDRLYTLIERHYHYTKSGRARQIMDRWPQSLGQFVKVTPLDYRRALQRKQASAKPPSKQVA